ncbi:hypothetical protein MBLNU230_g6893t1 [Neophaeotheca triangularis]
MSQNPAPLWAPRGGGTNSQQSAPPSRADQRSAPTATPAQNSASIPGLMAAFQQNAQLPEMLQGITPEQFMAIGQLFQSGAFSLPPTISQNAGSNQSLAGGSPSAATNGAAHHQHSVSAEKEEGELDEDESMEGTSRDFLRPPPKGPRNASPEDKRTRGRPNGRQSDMQAQASSIKGSKGRETVAQHLNAQADRRAPRAVSREPFQHPRLQRQPPRNVTAKESPGKEAQVLQFIRSMHEAGHTFDTLVAEVPRYSRELRQCYLKLGLPLPAEAKSSKPSNTSAHVASPTNAGARPALASPREKRMDPQSIAKPEAALSAPKVSTKAAKPPATAKAATAERQEMLARLAAVRANGSKQAKTVKEATAPVKATVGEFVRSETAAPSITQVAATASSAKGLETPNAAVVASQDSSTAPSHVSSVPAVPQPNTSKAAPAKAKNEEKNELLRKRLDALKAQKARQSKQTQVETPSSAAAQTPEAPHAADDGPSPVTLIPQGGVALPSSPVSSPVAPQLPGSRASPTTPSLPPTPFGGASRFSLPGLGMVAGQHPSLPGLGSFQCASTAIGSSPQPGQNHDSIAHFHPSASVPGHVARDQRDPSPSFAVASSGNKDDGLGSKTIIKDAADTSADQHPTRKRPAAAAFPEQPPPPAVKKPFGRNDPNETCIIETSDDEDNEYDTNPNIVNNTASHTRGPGLIRDFPPRPHNGPTIEHSSPGTPTVVTPGGDPATAYERKMQQLADLKRKMEEYQAKKLAKASGKTTPATSLPQTDAAARPESAIPNEHGEAAQRGAASSGGATYEQETRPKPADQALQANRAPEETIASTEAEVSDASISNFTNMVSGYQETIKNDASTASSESESESGEEMDIETEEEDNVEEAPVARTFSLSNHHHSETAAGSREPSAPEDTGDSNRKVNPSVKTPARTQNWLPGLAPATQSSGPSTSQTNNELTLDRQTSFPVYDATDGQSKAQSEDDSDSSDTSSSASTDSEDVDLPITRQKPSVELSANHMVMHEPASDLSSNAQADEIETPTIDEADFAPELQAPPPEAPTRVNETMEDPKPKPRFTTYESPLLRFKDYRFHPEYPAAVPGGFRSSTYSSRIDANKPICPFELGGGRCNDNACDYQHFKDMSYSDPELISTLGNSAPLPPGADRREWADGLNQVIKELRGTKGKLDASDIMKRIVQYRRDFVGDKTKVLNLE